MARMKPDLSKSQTQNPNPKEITTLKRRKGSTADDADNTDVMNRRKPRKRRRQRWRERSFVFFVIFCSKAF
jgi:hypothetical protein